MAELGIDVAQVVARSGIPRATIYRILSGTQKNPKFDTLTALAHALEWDVAALRGLANDVAARTTSAILMTEPAGMSVYYKRQGTQSTHQGRGEYFPPQPLDPRLQGKPVRASRILDDHLAGLNPPVPAGHTAFYAVLTPNELFLEFGRIYLINTVDSDGKIGPSFRQLRIYPDMYEFLPVTPDAGRNERERITVAKDALASGEIEIAGIFFASACVYL